MEYALDAVRARDVHKTYGQNDSAFQALSGVSLAVKMGEAVAIVGKSGSGKSTLMHILALLDTPDSGSVYYDDLDVSTLPERQLNAIRNRNYGFVFQQFFLNGRQSVLDNVMLPLVIGGVPRAERRYRAEEALESVGLASKAQNRASDLSGGQKQRTVIARALVSKPDIIFADEPTGNLDSTTGTQIEDLLCELNRTHGITLIVVTHDTSFARRFHRQVLLRDGRIESISRSAA